MFADRIAYQRAIEQVYWRHRIWPKPNAGPKPPLDKVISQAQIEKKVEDYLRNSQALQNYWQRPITPEQLQAEMERIASHTKQPEVLRELFEALGNDAFVIAECLARPVLAERLVTDLYAHDQRFHGELKRRAEAELQAHRSVTQMKQTSGAYTEMEWIKSGGAKDGSAPAKAKRVEAVKMSSSEWEQSVERLAAQFHSQDVGGQAPRLPNEGSASEAAALQKPPMMQIKTGVLSALQEDDAHYYAMAVLKKGKDRLKLATIAWLKEPLRSWLTKAEAQVPITMAAMSANYTLPALARPSGGCTDDTWTPTGTTTAPAGRVGHTAVWTGSEMIIWGGLGADPSYLNTGARYNPTTDNWTFINTILAPAPRAGHTAVWTGSEMIVWGGYGNNGLLNTGGRYDPSTDNWAATDTTHAPIARDSHTAVWTGSQMIIWGGGSSSCIAGRCDTGGRYDPGTNSWVATNTTNAPSGRSGHTAVWTGSQMIVWGGANSTSYLNSGGQYNASTDSWTTTSTSSAPDARISHTAVWTGSEMIVWGGYNASSADFNTGGRYNPSTDGWTATSATNVPTARSYHTGVWAGTEMIVWGGDGAKGLLNTGGKYDPSTDSWTATGTANAPVVRNSHTAVWTGSQMIVWGGLGAGPSYLNTGGRYCAQPASPCTDDTWTSTSLTNAPAGRTFHTAVWTGSEMIVWGGVDVNGVFNTGGRYIPTTDSWTATSTASAPAAREIHTAVWTGSEMIVWGGYDGSDLNTGGRYNPSADSWIATTTTNAPAARDSHAAVWTGSEMIVWGGFSSSSYFNTGGRYYTLSLHDALPI